MYDWKYNIKFNFPQTTIVNKMSEPSDLLEKNQNLLKFLWDVVFAIALTTLLGPFMSSR